MMDTEDETGSGKVAQLWTAATVSRAAIREKWSGPKVRTRFVGGEYWIVGRYRWVGGEAESLLGPYTTFGELIRAAWGQRFNEGAQRRFEANRFR